MQTSSLCLDCCTSPQPTFLLMVSWSAMPGALDGRCFAAVLALASGGGKGVVLLNGKFCSYEYE